MNAAARRLAIGLTGLLCVIECTGDLLAQCNPSVIGGVPAAGPQHVSEQLLRYDPDGIGPADPVLVSVGGFGVDEFKGVRALDYQRQEWYSLGGSSMAIDSAHYGVAFGDTAEEEGPFLAVTAGLGSTTYQMPSRPRRERVYRFDGRTWARMPDLPGYAAWSISSFDPDGDGPRPRTLVVYMDWYPPLADTTANARQAMRLDADGVWRGMGDAVVSQSEGRLLAWDPDGLNGPQPESLYLACAPLDESGVERPALLRWDSDRWSTIATFTGTIEKLRTFDFDAAGPEPAKLAIIGNTSSEGLWVPAPVAVFDGSQWEAIPGTFEILARDAVACSDGSVIMQDSNGFRRFERAEGVWTQKQASWPRNLPPYNFASLACIPDATDDRGYRVFGARYDFSLHSISDNLGDSKPYRVAEIPPIPTGYSNSFYLSTPGRGFNGAVADVTLMADGSLVATGDFTSVDGLLSPYIARRDPAGVWHSMWDPTWPVMPTGVSVLRDGRILATRATGYGLTTFQYERGTWSPFTDLGFAISTSRVIESDNGVLTILDFRRPPSNFSSVCAIVQLRDGELIPVACQLNQPHTVVYPNGDIVCSVTPQPDLPGFETGLAYWDGVSWTAMGEGDQHATNLRLSEDGTLLGLKQPNSIWRWNGSTWVADARVPAAALYGTWLFSFDVVGPNTFVGRGSIVDPFTMMASSTIYIHDGVWEGAVADTDSRLSSPRRAFAMPDGTVMVVGNLNLNGSNHLPTHFGMYQLSACNTCSPCVADWDESGGVDFADVVAFFVDYEQGNRCADVDDSAGVDATDMAIFFQAYEAGGC